MRSLALLISREAGMEKCLAVTQLDRDCNSLCYAIHNWPTCLLCITGQNSFSFPQKTGRDRAISFSTGCTCTGEPGPGGKRTRACYPWSQAGTTAHRRGCTLCDAGLWWVLGAVLKDIAKEIKEHLPLTSLIKKEIFSLNCRVLKSGVLSNSTLCTCQVVKLHWS